MISSQTYRTTREVASTGFQLDTTRKSTEAILMPASGAHSLALFDIASGEIYVHAAEKLSQQPPSISVIFETGPS
jgi:hypothetical protein